MRIILGCLLVLVLSGTAFAQSNIAVYAEDFRDKSSLALMIYLKVPDANICIKDIKISTNFGEESMNSLGCTAEGLENYFMVYPDENDDITKLQILKLTGSDSNGKTINLAELLKPQYSPYETTARIDISIASPAPVSKGGRFAVAAIHLSSTFELNDTVWNFLSVTSEREQRDVKRKMNLKRSASDFFGIIRELNSEPISILGLTQNQIDTFQFGLQKTQIQTIGSSHSSHLSIDPQDNSIIYIKYDFRSTPVPVEKILPDIKSKFGEPRVFSINNMRAFYVWQDGNSLAVLHGMLEGEYGKKRTIVTHMELLDYGAVAALANSSIKRFRAEQEAQQNQIGSAFK